EGLPFVAPAGKPGREAFHEGCRLVGARPSETIYVGDQLITDVLGPQRAGLRSILLRPRYSQEALSSKFQRVVAKGLQRLTR
ncbi:MAG TPA: HAD hydrolase-like protein, partial [Actinomycetota bacterium]|nr:HAD hydrolase-like protein [Actinomycetota bacterium]